ncbi:MAG: bifunctional phosphopantothenoylcysteine decarboxylase/phosphopantothenate--cysteine ligase CoaBC [bacterium]
MNILVTAGPTREHLDPIRFLSNRSTGKMGFAIAAAAAERGHTVTLIAGPVSLTTPPGVTRIDVVSARDMLTAVQSCLPKQDALIMSAAVADFRPAHMADSKLKKSQMNPVIPLEPNPDILKTISPLKGSRIFVGFAAETGDPIAEAQRKLASKGLDMIVANDVTAEGAGFAVDTNRVTFITANEQPRALPLQSKVDVGRAIIDWLEKAECWNRGMLE